MLKLENTILKENNIEIFETKRFDKLIYNAMVKTEFETYRKIVAAEKVNITLDRAEYSMSRELCGVQDITISQLNVEMMKHDINAMVNIRVIKKL